MAAMASVGTARALTDALNLRAGFGLGRREYESGVGRYGNNQDIFLFRGGLVE
jgi:hypothetical protein